MMRIIAWFKRNFHDLFVMSVAIIAIGLAVYAVLIVPREVQTYFNEHRAELTGPRGLQGIKGDKGDTGQAGANGKNGATGKAGQNGQDGGDGCTWLGWSNYWPYEDLGFVCP